MFKILESLDIIPFLNQYDLFKEDLQWTEYPNGRQLGLQYKTGGDPWRDAVGRAKSGQDWSVGVAMNPFFVDTVFEQFIKKHNLTRTRFMWVKPYSCYSMHKDDSPRIHLPLITDTHSYFVFRETGLLHMEVGNVYWVDTTKEHTFINCSDKWRLHLVGAC